ncbi:ABC transporter ATP-binding protein [Aestuariirhabdus sp. Z084]|uniref:ABC transporter ATP-binding protein n=1 Tax=Aestuariirhabdus haliotis TaxID=2918751 RepID=UPI00201B44E2|nr:ABC transporter ATP-binding protein [Aestuariirhabdus haliotis]MCL6414845.1 ABC transporter ATP-binding protein [Aestuariirhabdus haliotis]MCL6418777.1 ABC transporter ATP-binding protein [Aestuariirhabdus haliotis]
MRAAPIDKPAHEMLEIRDLVIEFDMPGGSVRALDRVSFNVREGQTLALVGESGSGKSVCSQAILGILPANARIHSGSIEFRDPKHPGHCVDIAALDNSGADMRNIRGGQISIIFQEPMVSMSAMHTIGDQVSEALFLHRKMSRAKGLEVTQEMLALVGFRNPQQAMNLYPFELSGGLRQRAMIAMALICHPALLIADEPTTALDVTVQKQILRLIRRLQAELNMAVLLITHDLGVVANMADEVVVMYHGRVVERGPLEALFQHPQHDYLQSLFRAVPRFNLETNERLNPIRSSAGGLDNVQELYTPWTEQQRLHAPHLSIRELSKTYVQRKSGWWGGGDEEHIHAVRDFNLDIAVGESLGLVGESGCGKTTLSKMLMRGLEPSTGSILYNDRGTTVPLLDLEGPELEQFRPRMQLVFQDPYSALSPRMTINDIICEPLLIHHVGDKAYRERRARELMALVGLSPEVLNRYPHSFSGGQRQRISIARALALSPDLLILDEPVSALDVSVQAQILNLLKDLQKELGLTYLFISHNLAVVDYIAERVVVMCHGQVVEVAPTKELFASPLHPYTRALIDAVPAPDLNQLLDFDNQEAGLAQPEFWPQPYTLSPHIETSLIEVENNHWVRMHSDEG